MTAPKFGVQFQPLSHGIDAGRLGTAGQRTVFKDKCDVTGQAIWAVAQWIEAGGEPHEIFRDIEGGEGYRITVEKLT
ncbi:hypothetical protein FHT44_005157 [Mycolicibacterium sp. BK634]|uniref:DUF7446 family protein n=1 Tax=Mycolicibacterium sp. BK634 TaxID=2587099 RepID=UPI001608BEDC|nr:hypothetical protein [Mycolicibacterium sp. BK634]MBB3752645.1 hypothetical protein [Mycolicibacterium sp. BK634]